MSDEKNKYHEYDGIVEHNNPMPGWWSWTFILTIIFAFIYYIHYEIAGGPTLQDELKASMQEVTALQAKSASQIPELSEEALMKKLSSPEMLQTGAALFAARCAVCHGEKLEGKIGPNLTDAVWINGGTPKEILKTIRQGVGAKGMPAWEGVLKPDEIYAAIAFILSKKQ